MCSLTYLFNSHFSNLHIVSDKWTSEFILNVYFAFYKCTSINGSEKLFQLSKLCQLSYAIHLMILSYIWMFLNRVVDSRFALSWGKVWNNLFSPIIYYWRWWRHLSNKILTTAGFKYTLSTPIIMEVTTYSCRIWNVTLQVFVEEEMLNCSLRCAELFMNIDVLPSRWYTKNILNKLQFLS